MPFLYTEFEGTFARDAIADTKVPRAIADNLKFNIRPYQAEAFKRFVLWQKNLATGREPHLLFNMATGSGKTLIMAGLILTLYAQGHRNFLFFVNSNNIIRKTKDNFLNSATAKYLFVDKIQIDGAPVAIREVDRFDESDADNINIKFTTIHQLHTDLKNYKENGVTLDDFAAHNIVLLADEAHHFSAATAKQHELPETRATWEGTVEKIFKANTENNMLFEFTATVNYDIPEIVEKYQDKIIYKYGLAQFRLDKYSKEISLVRSRYEENERIIQALILSLYRATLAGDNLINLKPVILFKAQKTIRQSEYNKENFHELIANFSSTNVNHIRQTSTIEIVQKAFQFFDAKQLSASAIAERIKANFAPQNCLSANDEKETDLNQIRLNTLEDQDNPIRAVFAVQKLNEGWDVLNLFDIVRLYETRDSNNTRPGKTTISEAQLIGRGARYYPFGLSGYEDKYTRKFDNDAGNELKILEELYYHTRDDSRYISEIKRALEDTGIYEDEEKTDLVELVLKEKFKETEFYKTGKVFYNEKTYPDTHELIRDTYQSFDTLKAVQRFEYRLASGGGKIETAFDILTSQDKTLQTTKKQVPLSEIQPHVIKSALAYMPFFWFSNLNKCFGIGATSDFIKDKKFLGGLKITFKGTEAEFANINNYDYFWAVRGLLNVIENEVKDGAPEFEVSEFSGKYVCKVFKDKKVRVKREYTGGQPLVSDAAWYVYTNNYGTPEEKAFVQMFAGQFKEMAKKYKSIYLIRNEREVKITNKGGQTFEPDYVLFCKPKQGKDLIYQIFIEPKGDVFMHGDKWKEDFLLKLDSEIPLIKINAGEYKIYGLPFYNEQREQDKSLFENEFIDLLKLKNRIDEIPSKHGS